MVVLLLLQVDGRVGGRIGQVPLAVDALALVPQAGGKLVTLGPRILRTETAGIAALTIAMALRGEME